MKTMQGLCWEILHTYKSDMINKIIILEMRQVAVSYFSVESIKTLAWLLIISHPATQRNGGTP